MTTRTYHVIYTRVCAGDDRIFPTDEILHRPHAPPKMITARVYRSCAPEVYEESNFFFVFCFFPSLRISPSSPAPVLPNYSSPFFFFFTVFGLDDVPIDGPLFFPRVLRCGGAQQQQSLRNWFARVTAAAAAAAAFKSTVETHHMRSSAAHALPHSCAAAVRVRSVRVVRPFESVITTCAR